MFVVDLLHEFELGIWKAIFTHLLRLLYAEGNDRIQTLNKRCVTIDYHMCSAHIISDSVMLQALAAALSGILEIMSQA
jgi:hypothetical protein